MLLCQVRDLLEALLSWAIEPVLVFKAGLVPLGCSLPRSEHCYHFIAIDPQVIYSNDIKSLQHRSLHAAAVGDTLVVASVCRSKGFHRAAQAQTNEP